MTKYRKLDVANDIDELFYERLLDKDMENGKALGLNKDWVVEEN